MPISLPLRISFISLVFSVLVSSVLTGLGGYFLYQQQTDNAIVRARLAADELASRTSRLLALDMRFEDFIDFDEQCSSVIRSDTLLRDAAVFDTQGFQHFHNSPGGIAWPQGEALPAAGGTKIISTESGAIVVRPILESKQRVVGYALVAVDGKAVVSATLRVVSWLVASALLLLIVSLAIQQGYFWRAVGRPLARLVRTVDSIRPEEASQIPTLLAASSDDDDIGRVYQALSRLMQRLLDARGELLAQNERLEAAVLERTQQLEHANSELARDIERRKELEDELRTLASTDSLTGLANRAFILPYLERRLEHVRRSNTPLGLLLFDFDDFKQINDTYGHAVGDQVLQIMGKRIEQVCRQSDVLARLGGDEFLVAFEAYLDDAQVESLCNRIVALFDSPMQLGNLSLRVGVSIGVALFQRNGDDLTTLLAAADSAMYAAKQSGGGFRFA